MSPRRLLATALPFALALAAPAAAAEKFIAFGDSITYGWFDGANPNGTNECIEDLGRSPNQVGRAGWSGCGGTSVRSSMGSDATGSPPATTSRRAESVTRPMTAA